jgi:flavin-dependent dehydrogenase
MRILIVGAGIAGLVTAKVLRQVGFNVLVIDRAPDIGVERDALALDADDLRRSGSPPHEAIVSRQVCGGRPAKAVAAQYVRGFKKITPHNAYPHRKARQAESHLRNGLLAQVGPRCMDRKK